MSRYAVVQNGVVTNIVEAEPLFAAGMHWIDAEGAKIGSTWNGETFADPTPEPKSPEKVYAEIVASVQTRLDDFAATRNYSGIMSACTYATSTVTKFATEAQYCVEVRDATWATCYAIMADVQAGQRPMPTGYADIESELPELVWPV